MKMSYCPVKSKVLEKAGCQFVTPSDYKGECWTYTFSTEPFSLSLINKKKSQDKVQNRWNGKINPDYVARYSLCMEANDEFPGIVVFKEGNEWFLADGFHTLEAAGKVGTDCFSGVFMFSVESPIEVAATFNCRTTGNSEPIAETLEKAVRLYRQREIECIAAGLAIPTQKSWAAKFLLSENRFNTHYRTTLIKKELSQLGVAADKFEDVTLESLGRLLKSDQTAAKSVAKLVSQFGIKSSEVKKIETEYANPLLPAQDKHKVIDRYASILKSATDNGTLLSKRRSRRKSPETTFKESITKLANTSQKVDVESIKLLMADEMLVNSVNLIQKFLKEISGK